MTEYSEALREDNHLDGENACELSRTTVSKKEEKERHKNNKS